MKDNYPTKPLYSALPYPDDGVVRTTISTILFKGIQKYAPHLLTKTLDILDLGCGTGEVTAGIALKFQDAKVTGVDINEVSLLKAKELTRKKKINVTFEQTDILGGEPPKKKYDIITSIGVLHHLEDPKSGFSKVRGLIKNDGIFLCAVYSRLGRWNDMAVRHILDHILSVTSFDQRAEAINHLRLSSKHGNALFFNNLIARLRFGPPLNWFEIIQVFLKRKKISHISDTFSNPCEHLFYFRELLDIFSQTGWSFISIAENSGLPVSAYQHSRNKNKLKLLGQLPQDVLFDYFAFCYQPSCFTFFLKPELVK